MLLIGLNGFKQVGKNTVADYLTEHYGFQQLSFAYKVKQSVAALIGIHTPIIESWKDRKDIDVRVLGWRSYQDLPEVLTEPITVRHLLQRMGTEVGRNIFGDDFWVDQCLPQGVTFRAPTVITDARFPNELQRIKSLGGYNIEIRRPGIESDGHASEMTPPPYLIDFVINNGGDVLDLYSQVEDILASL